MQVSHVFIDLHLFALTQVWQSVVKRRDICASDVQPKGTPNVMKRLEKSLFSLLDLYGFQCALFFDRQKLTWRNLDAFRTNV